MESWDVVAAAPGRERRGRQVMGQSTRGENTGSGDKSSSRWTDTQLGTLGIEKGETRGEKDEDEGTRCVLETA